LSQIFLKLEEESERRAIEAEEAHSPNIPDLAIAARRAAQQRQRNRGSVSVSRFGHIEEDAQQQTSLSPSQMPPPAFVHGMTTFYGNRSVDSLSDVSYFGDDTGLSAESEHVTQVHRIAGRQSLPRSVGGMLQRTLTRARTNGGLSSSGINTNVVVGVVVEKDHVEEAEPREGLPRSAMVYAQAPSTLGPQSPQSSRVTIPGAERREANGSWRSKAGELFRRKAQPRRTLWSMTPS